MTAELTSRIEAHGRDLLAIFPNAIEQDPVKLCKKLRRLESKGAAIALRLCNGPEYAEGEQERITYDLLRKVNILLANANTPIFINLDPRGYALKIPDEYMRAHDIKLHRDWGGYGIIAPDFRDA